MHILWINLVTDGLPALALVMDPAAPDVLDRPPRPAREPILGRRQWLAIVLIGLLEAGIALSVFVVWGLHERDLTHARSMAFSVLVFSELFRSFAARSSRQVFWQVGVFTNVRLLVVALSFAGQLAIHHIPFTQRLFDIDEISLFDCLLGVALGLIPVTLIELSKLVLHARRVRGSGTRN